MTGVKSEPGFSSIAWSQDLLGGSSLNPDCWKTGLKSLRYLSMPGVFSLRFRRCSVILVSLNIGFERSMQWRASSFGPSSACRMRHHSASESSVYSSDDEL